MRKSKNQKPSGKVLEMLPHLKKGAANVWKRGRTYHKMWGSRCPDGTCTNTEMTNEFLGIQEFGESTHSIPMHVGLNVQTIIAFIVTLQLRVTWGRICNVFPHISVWELTSTNRHSRIIICDASVKHKDWVIVYLGWNVVCQRFLCN